MKFEIEITGNESAEFLLAATGIRKPNNGTMPEYERARLRKLMNDAWLDKSLEVSPFESAQAGAPKIDTRKKTWGKRNTDTINFYTGKVEVNGK